MAATARRSEYSRLTRDVMRSLWHVIQNEPEQTAPPPDEGTLDFDELRRTLVLVKEAIHAERQRVIELQARVEELEEVEDAYLTEKRDAEELRADRDCWRSQALLVANFVPRR